MGETQVRTKCALKAGILACASLSAHGAEAEKAHYAEDVAPVVANLGCASAKCHGSEAGAGGIKLSMFSADLRADCEALSGSFKGRPVNFKTPSESLLLKKLDGRLPHTGGALAPAGSEAAKKIEGWIASGCPLRDANAPELVSISLERPEIVLRPGEKARTRVLAKYSDGSERDVTASAEFSCPQGFVSVSKGGEVSASGFGLAFADVSFSRKFATLTVVAAKQPSVPFPDEASENPIDKFAAKMQKKAGIAPSGICTDAEFLRRLYFDATGLPPTAEQADAFLRDQSKDKRKRLVSKLLDSPEFADRLAMKLSDLLRIKSEFPSNLWPNGAQAYHAWLRDAVASGMPFDVMARRMLLSSGSDFKDPPVNFYRAVNTKDAENFAEATALVFMGARTNCVKCHAHPNEEWTQEDGTNLADFFRHMSVKKSKEWKEEVLTLDLDQPAVRSGADYFIFGEKISSPPGRDPREAFAEWLLRPGNPYFARAAASRVWFWIFGAGLVEPADDIRPNKPSLNPEILDFLAREFESSGFRLRRLYELIFTSLAYQRSSVPNATNADDFFFFSRHIPRRLDAESLNDALGTILGVWQPFKSITPEPYAFWPEDFRAGALHDGSVSNPFLTLFGKPGRNSSHLNDRSNAVSMQQLLHMMGSENIRSKLDNSKFLKDIAKSPTSPEEKVSALYLAFLSRRPSQDEMKACGRHITEGGKPVLESVKDIAWALANTREFLFKM